MTPFSIVFCLIVLAIILKEKKPHAIFASLLAMTMAIQVCSIGGYFIKIGTTEIDYEDVALLLTAIFGFISSKNKTNKNTFVCCMLLIGWMLLGLFATSAVTPKTQILPTSIPWDAYFYGRANKVNASVTSSSILSLIKVVITLVIWCFVSNLNNDDYIKISNVVLVVSKVQIIWLIAEIVSKNIFHTNIFPELRNIIFGLGRSTHTDLSLRGQAYTVFGWTREAAAVPGFLFRFIAILILSKSIKENKWWLVLGVAIMALSMSFSMIMYVIALVLLFVLVYQRKPTKKAVLGSLVLILITLTAIYFVLHNQYYYSRIIGFMNDFSFITSSNNVFSGTITSSKVRLYGMIETMKVLLERPLLGFGIGVAYCNSSIVMILSNIGIVGLILWIKTIKSASSLHKNNPLRWEACFITFIFAPNVLTGSSALLYSTNIILQQHLLDVLDEDWGGQS